MTTGISPTSTKIMRMVLGSAVACWCVVVAGLYGIEWAKLRLAPLATVGDGPIDPWRKFSVPGIVQPSVVEAEASTLKDDEPVIGFVVGGRARAYRLDALRDRSRHVVNDLVGEVPVTVSYCDLSHCVRGYTGPPRNGPLDVAVGGLYQGHDMVLEIGGRLYFQESGKPLVPGDGPPSIPLEPLKPIPTTWGEWKRLHQATDIYEGPP